MNTFSNLRLVKIINLLLAISILLMLLIIFEVVMFSIHLNVIFIVLGTCLLTLLIMRLSGYNAFYIDTTGEVITFESHRCSRMGLGSNLTKKVDFPKVKLLGYGVKKGLLGTTITLIVSTKKNKSGKVKIPFRLSFLSKRNRGMIEDEFDTILKSNKEIKRETILNTDIKFNH